MCYFYANFHNKLYILTVFSGSLLINFTTVTALRLITVFTLSYLLFVREVFTNAALLLFFLVADNEGASLLMQSGCDIL